MKHIRATREADLDLSLPLPSFLGRTPERDVCRLAACFPLSALSPRLMNCCHPSTRLLCSSTHGAHPGSNTWEDKCSVKLNKHNPDMLHSSPSVMCNSHGDSGGERSGAKTNSNIRWPPGDQILTKHPINADFC